MLDWGWLIYLQESSFTWLLTASLSSSSCVHFHGTIYYIQDMQLNKQWKKGFRAAMCSIAWSWKWYTITSTVSVDHSDVQTNPDKMWERTVQECDYCVLRDMGSHCGGRLSYLPRKQNIFIILLAQYWQWFCTF